MLNTTENLTLLDKEEQVKPLLKGISENNPEDLRKFFELFSDDIYNFPIRYYNLTEDDAGEFYLYAFEHLKNGKKIASFKFKSKFTTWFFSVLRNLLIDFLRRNKHKLKILPLYKVDSDGNQVNVIDNIPDLEQAKEENSQESEIFHHFTASLNSLKIYNRVLFKLAFIHYIDFNEEELTWLCDFNKMEKGKMLSTLSRLKEIGLEKSHEVRDIEDKLTSNFMAISNYENKIDNFFKDHPSLKNDSENWTEHYENSTLPPELVTWIQTLMKKRKKHIALLQSQKKSLLCTRLPYKYFSSLLNASDGVLSVQLLRVIEKLNEDFKETPEIS